MKTLTLKYVPNARKLFMKRDVDTKTLINVVDIFGEKSKKITAQEILQGLYPVSFKQKAYPSIEVVFPDEIVVLSYKTIVNGEIKKVREEIQTGYFVKKHWLKYSFS